MQNNKKIISRCLYWILFIIGIIIMLDFVFLMFFDAVINVGIVFTLVLGILLTVIGYLKLFKNIIIFKNKYVFRLIIACATIFIISFAAVQAFIWSGLKDEKNIKVDHVILLGAGLKGDKITATFANRMENCVEYLKANPKAEVIVTGGQGTGETISEAEAMKKYLLEREISENRITKEDKATSTFENFKYSKEILNNKFGNQSYTVMVITSDFHMFRAKMLAKRNGFTAYGIPSRTWWGIFPNSCAREYFAIIKSFLVDR